MDCTAFMREIVMLTGITNVPKGWEHRIADGWRNPPVLVGLGPTASAPKNEILIVSNRKPIILIIGEATG